MLVYSTMIRLSPDEDPTNVVRIVAEWLSQKSHAEVPTKLLLEDGLHKLADGSKVQIIKSHSDIPYYHAIRFSHGDKDTAGRQWITEIGLWKEKDVDKLDCSILLKTDEISARVESNIQPTVPYVVHEIIRKCSLSPETIGLAVIPLENNWETAAFGYTIEQPERKHPIVLISPKEDGTYNLNFERLRFFLESIAEVIQIPVGTDTFQIGKIIGNQYVSWRGAINIIFPQVTYRGDTYFPCKRLTPDAINNLLSSGIEIEREILSLILHRINLPNSWRHITPEKVADVIRKDELKRLRNQAQETGKSTEYTNFLEEYTSGLDKQIAQLQEEINNWEALYSRLDEENKQLGYDHQSLKQSMSYSSKVTAAEIIPGYLYDVLEIASKSFTPKESLQIITKVFPQRIVVLDEAWKSADQSNGFRDKKKAFELLWKLSTEYWEALVNGRGDTDARAVFGNTYAANESDTAEKNKRAKQLRTFMYKGQDVEMMKHLRIGVKPSPYETIRIHFEWDFEDKKIVIGYCGPHLDHK